jgi:hypothetical protein
VRSLSSIIRDAEDGDLLARSLAAIVDSGMIVTLRDAGGRFVQVSPVFAQALGVRQGGRGHERVDGHRFYDAQGRQLAMREHPAYLARVSGAPQRNRLLGVRNAEREAWMLMSYMPVEQTSHGWSVLGIGSDVTSLVQRLHGLEARATVAESLLALALRATSATLTTTEATSAVTEALHAALPQVEFGLLLCTDTELLLLTSHDASGRACGRRSIPLTDDVVARWATARPHLGHDLREVGVGPGTPLDDWARGARSLVVAPAFDADGGHVASLVAIARGGEILGADHVRVIETAARLVGPALRMAAPVEAC